MKRFVFRKYSFILFLAFVSQSVLAAEHTWDGDKIYISYNMEHPDEFGSFESVVTIYSEEPDDPDCENSITFHDASSYDNNNHYTPSNSIILNSNNPIESVELSYFDFNHGGWLVITETGFYDVVLNKNLDEEGNEIITITAHAHKPEPVLKEDQTPTGYYYCKYCRKYFADEIGTIQIDEEDVEYKVASIKEISSRDILPVIKYFENNMLVIEKNGVKYDILGRRLKQ